MLKNIELFISDCRLCDTTNQLLTRYFPTVDITIHRAAECIDGSCCSLAAQYGIKAVPSLVVDGEIVLVGVPDKEDIKSLAAYLT